jgi:hypothetical protein
LLKVAGDPLTPYFEWQFLKVVHAYLTTRWGILQGGHSTRALHDWLECLTHLELDLKAHRDLLLLAQAGVVGRTHANRILWKTLTVAATDRSYGDLSRMVTHLVYAARRTFDRPPRGHEDMSRWTWSYYEWCSYADAEWSPEAVPRVPVGQQRTLKTGPGGEPLPPPGCWG